MNIYEKLSNLTDEQIERFSKFLQDFDCSGISCHNCLFKADNGRCLFISVGDEHIRRTTVKDGIRLHNIRTRLANGAITPEEATEEILKVFTTSR